MKKIFIVLFFFPILNLAQLSQKKIVASQFRVEGNCEICKKTIEKAALSVRGVKMAIWDIPSNKISLLYDRRKVEVKTIHNFIAKSGYSTTEVKAKEEDYNKLPLCCQY